MARPASGLSDGIKLSTNTVPEQHVGLILLSFYHSANVSSQPCLKAKLGKTPIKANPLAMAYVWCRKRQKRKKKTNKEIKTEIRVKEGRWREK